MVKNRILFIIYTPFVGYLPKRMDEINQRAKLDGVAQVIVTPSDYVEKLTGQEADTVHLIQLQPDNSVDPELGAYFFRELESLREIVEKIKYHNIQ